MAAATTSICKYTYKPCTHPRSVKRNGTLHLLCEFHRNKANAIQKTETRSSISNVEDVGNVVLDTFDWAFLDDMILAIQRDIDPLFPCT
ncbi:hypothetical protein SPRG_15438 [Saprolegnia parasitica CBS 223.65]|uniref:Uncharacterized protein n=1 Tax=Saprolegnia parasitica (strain CBS 223.65) TaxID=695850 RepID=A0A067BVL7_SAPPC|nr:hypothetical protein SPRG_15438 [Saprolegnia parasitica CBS 223.65]KDO18642.1 hypothetical protein SPRG_15438 [Saprolegnia parasitica CBS 223.65]|eukprot:XP_012210647.1 hypothetical protein SPRG_15438 [Saprolegnia parasitica CBS 223.65]